MLGLCVVVAACTHESFMTPAPVGVAAQQQRAEQKPERRNAKKPQRATRYDAAKFEARLRRIEARRVQFQRQYAGARTKGQRRAVRERARRYVLTTIIDDIFPQWMGTPWGMARNSTSTRPHLSGMTVGCSYFVTSVLQNAGLRLDNRYRFAQAPALHIQRSLAPVRADLQRYFSIPAPRLRAKIASHGDGLYIVGLVNHIAFVVVRAGRVRLVHSGYVPDSNVIDEPLVGAQVIDISKRAGYFVTPLFHDDWLIDHWLRAKPVRFRKLGTGA